MEQNEGNNSKSQGGAAHQAGAARKLAAGLPALAALFAFSAAPALAVAADTDPLGLANGTNRLFVDGSSPDCSDSYTRAQALDPATPWCNIEAGVIRTDLQPGDTIYVRGGVYQVAQRETNVFTDPSDNCLIRPRVSGTSGNPITLKAYNDEDVLIDGRWDIRDHNDDGAVEQAWRQCQWAGSACAIPCAGIPTQTSCESTYYIDYTWTESFPCYPNKGQLWEGGKLIPSAQTGNLAALATASRWLKDFQNNRIFYRAQSSGDPNQLDVKYANCAGFFGFRGVDFWVIDGIDLTAGIGSGYNIHWEKFTGDNTTSTNPSTDITIQNVKASYFGDNACTPQRDGTYGHGLDINTGPNILVKHNEFSQDVSECVHVGNNCPNNACGEHFIDNVIHDCAQDPGWNSECSYSWTSKGETMRFSNEQAAGMIVRSSGGIYEGNLFENNDGPGLLIESERARGEGLAYPSDLVIRNNRFVDNAKAAITGACVNGNIASANNLIYNNEFSNNARNTNWQGQINLSGNCDNYKIYNNTIVNGLYWGINIVKHDPPACGWDGGLTGPCEPENIEIKNNVFYMNGAMGHRNKTQEIALCPECLTGATISNNILYDPADILLTFGASAYICADVSGFQTSNACVDPQLIDPGGLDFHLQPTSPAIDSGTSLSSYFTADFEGDTRPQGAAWDIGADEFVPIGVCAPGDVNCDGQAGQSSDIQLVVNVRLGLVSDSAVIQRADLNSDTKVDAADIQAIVNMSLGV